MIRLERRYDHSVERVWRAITDPDELRHWFPGTLEVTESDPPRLLAGTWYEDNLRFELRPDGDGCVLTLSDTFEEIGKAARDAAGWHVRLDQLERALDGAGTAWDATERWREVHPSYVERLGPEASVIGPPQGHPAA